jgi:transcriptional regulator with XRE-family HTH domain
MRKCKTDVVEIKKFMAERDINTVVELSQKSGIDRNTLGKILSGTVQPSSNAMERLVYALDIPPEKAGQIFFANNLRKM